LEFEGESFGSPKSSTGKPVRFAIFVIRKVSDEIFSGFINNHLENGEGDSCHSIMHEFSISESEGEANRVDIGKYNDKHSFCGDGKVKESI